MDDNGFRIGNGYDVHALREGLPMWLCGVRIESGKGFVAHSDGDVAIHALCDALLGAAALGDIGQHFPDTDDRWKGAAGVTLLKLVREKIGRAGYGIANVDITIALQAPKLAPHIPEMRRNIAETLAVRTDQVSVKATTTERLGFVGRGEGCEARATVLLFRGRPVSTKPIQELF